MPRIEKSPVSVGYVSSSPEAVLVAWPGYPTVLVEPGGPAPEWIPAESLSSVFVPAGSVPSTPSTSTTSPEED